LLAEKSTVTTTQHDERDNVTQQFTMFSCCQIVDKNLRLARRKDLAWSKPVYKLTHTKRSVEKRFHLFYEETCGKGFGDTRFVVQDLQVTPPDLLFFTRTFRIFDENENDEEDTHHFLTFPQFSMAMWNFLSLDLYMLSEWLFRTHFGGPACDKKSEATIAEVVHLISLIYGEHEDDETKEGDTIELVQSHANDSGQMNTTGFAQLVKQAPELLQRVFGIQLVAREQLGGVSYWGTKAKNRNAAVVAGGGTLKTSGYDDIVETIQQKYPNCLCMPHPDVVEAREVLLGQVPGRAIRGLDTGMTGRVAPSHHTGSNYAVQEGVPREHLGGRGGKGKGGQGGHGGHGRGGHGQGKGGRGKQHHQEHRHGHRPKPHQHDHANWDVDVKHHHAKKNYGDWVKEQDAETKMEYYRNVTTGKKQYQEPEVVSVS